MTTIKENSFYIAFALGILLVAAPVLAYGVSAFIPFWKAFAIISTTLVPTLVCLKLKSDNEETAETYLKKEMAITEDQLSASWKQIEELEVVLKDYEDIYDRQQWEIPCNCGQNTFVGLFSPYADNICECEKCKSKYRITLNYESILMSEPLDNDTIFNSLKTRLESDQAV
jgi:hypothetical protein